MQFSLFIKIATIVFTTLAFALGITAVLGYFKFRKTLIDFVQDRAVVSALSAQSAIESNLDLGLSLVMLRTLPDILGRVRSTDPSIQSMVVFELRRDDASIIYATDGRAAEEVVPPAWLAAQAHAEGPFWTLTEPDTVIVGVPLRNSFGQNVGGVTLLYSRAYVDDKLADAASQLAVWTAALLGASAVLSVIGSFFIFRPVQRRLAMLTRSLHRLDTGNIVRIGTEGNELESGIGHLEEKVGAALCDLEVLSNELARTEARA